MGQEHRKTSCIFLNKMVFYKQHSYLTHKLQALKRKTPLIVKFERIRECVLR